MVDSMNAFLLLQLFVLAIAAPDSLASEDLEIEFKEVAVVKWDELQSFLSKVRGSAERTEFSGSEEHSSSVLDFMVNGQSQKCVTTDTNSADSLAVCRSHSQNYAFFLTMDFSSGGFGVHNLWTYQPSASIYKLPPAQEIMHRELSKFLDAPFATELYSFPSLCKSSGFEVLKVSFANEDTDDLVEIRFEYESPKPELVSSLQNGLAVFSRSNHWAMTRFSAETSWGGLSSETEYEDEDSNGFRFPRSVQQKLWAGAPFKSELCDNVVCKFVELETFEAPSKEFTLAAFGLAEPASQMRNGNQSRFYVFWIAAVFLVFFIALLASQRKEQV